MTPAERIAIRMDETFACIMALEADGAARLILSARHDALRDALEILEAAAEGTTPPAAAQDIAGIAAATAAQLPARGAATSSAPASRVAPSALPAGPAPESGQPLADPAPGAGSPAAPPHPRVAPSAAAPESGQPSQPSPPPDTPYTPERIALVTRLWGDTALTLQQVFEAANAIPAAQQMISAEALRYHVAKHHGLPMSRRDHAAQLAAAPKKGHDTRSAPVPPPEPTEDEIAAKARALLREGHGAEQVAARTGLTAARVRAMIAIAEDQAREMLGRGMATEDIVAATSLPPGAIRALREARAA